MEAVMFERSMVKITSPTMDVTVLVGGDNASEIAARVAAAIATGPQIRVSFVAGSGDRRTEAQVAAAAKRSGSGGAA
jgi:phage tail sheath gpL-like